MWVTFSLVSGCGEHDLVQPVEELRTEGPLEQLIDLVLGLLADLSIRPDAVQQELAAQVGGSG